jgi:hypothetical protein
MPDEIGWPAENQEKKLDAARAEADRRVPATPASKAEVDRRCEAARRYRIEREARKP